MVGPKGTEVGAPQGTIEELTTEKQKLVLQVQQLSADAEDAERELKMAKEHLDSVHCTSSEASYQLEAKAETIAKLQAELRSTQEQLTLTKGMQEEYVSELQQLRQQQENELAKMIATADQQRQEVENELLQSKVGRLVVLFLLLLVVVVMMAWLSLQLLLSVVAAFVAVAFGVVLAARSVGVLMVFMLSTGGS